MAEVERSAGSTVFQWLIERGQPEGEPEAVWLENSAAHPASHRRWTDDAHSAAMFPTRETAEAYIAEEVLAARAVEHGFMTEAPTTEIPDAASGHGTDCSCMTCEGFRQACEDTKSTRPGSGVIEAQIGSATPKEREEQTMQADSAARGPLLVHFTGSTPPRPAWADCEDCSTYWRENSSAVIHAAASVGIEHGLTTNAAIDIYLGERHAKHA